MNLKKLIFTNNACYKAGRTIAVRGIMVHSTGANNPNLKRYVGPDDGVLGRNQNNNHWNQDTPDGHQVCVHGFIGKLDDGSIATYQTLPWNHRGWHCGGDANNTHISFEICEDGLTDASYFNRVYQEAVEFCAYLCKMYNFNPMKDGVIIGHYEGYRRGIASNHSDPSNWFPKHGKSMDTFRAAVKAALAGGETTTGEGISGATTGGTATSTPSTYNTGLYQVIIPELNIRSGAGVNHGVVGTIKDKGTYTIVEIQNGSWGKLKSGAGWINCDKAYCKRVGDATSMVATNAPSTKTPTASNGAFQVRVTIDDLNIRTGAGTNHKTTGAKTGKGTFTIVETKNGTGSKAGWGRLKSGAGWISLDYGTRI